MEFANLRSVVALSEAVTPSPAEISFSDLSKDELLLELRAVHVVLAETQKMLEIGLLRDQQFGQLTLAYDAAMKACVREERMRKELEHALRNAETRIASSRAGLEQ